MLNFAIIGFGALGKTHFRNVKEVTDSVGDIKLVALCDVEEKAFTTQTASNLGSEETSLDLSEYTLYNDAEEMFIKEKLDFVITALPTYLHEKIAVMAMEHGINVFSEKPMAINLEQAQNMIDSANKNNVKLMIGQCLRFFPEYVMLKNIIDSKKYGEVVRAEFTRLSKTPGWSWQNWMLDESKSGNDILDLHVHDVDFINWAFGMPKAVTSVATNGKTPHDSIMTFYDYGDGKVVASKSDWGYPECYPFTAVFSVRFEKATVELRGDGMWLYPENGDAEKLEVPAGNGYALEVIEFINCIRENRVSEINPPEDSMASISIAFAERKSADTKITVTL